MKLYLNTKVRQGLLAVRTALLLQNEVMDLVMLGQTALAIRKAAEMQPVVVGRPTIKVKAKKAKAAKPKKAATAASTKKGQQTLLARLRKEIRKEVRAISAQIGEAKSLRRLGYGPVSSVGRLQDAAYQLKALYERANELISFEEGKKCLLKVWADAKALVASA